MNIVQTCYLKGPPPYVYVRKSLFTTPSQYVSFFKFGMHLLTQGKVFNVKKKWVDGHH